MANGSGLFAKQRAKAAHLLGTGGIPGELADLRDDVAAELAPMAAFTVDEFTDPATAAPAGLEAATATTVASRVVTTFLAGGVAALAAYARNVTFTTAGTTPADAPATAVVLGTDLYNKVQTETVALAQTASSATTTKAYKTVTKVTYAAADGTGATVSIGFGTSLGLSKTIKSRAGLATALKEIEAGVVVTTGAFNASNRLYVPAATPNGARDYAVYYEYDPVL